VNGPKSVAVSLNLPFGLGGVTGTWEPDQSEKLAAWEMYVELVTRIAVVELGPSEGLLSEALTSLYSLFATTREILREKGPSVAQAKGQGDYSFGYLAVVILNRVLRPVLAKWHPLLVDHESRRSPGSSAVEHEMAWNRSSELRQVLAEVRKSLVEYADLLASVAGVPPLSIESGASE
jgi:hypothetical protein